MSNKIQELVTALKERGMADLAQALTTAALETTTELTAAGLGIIDKTTAYNATIIWGYDILVELPDFVRQSIARSLISAVEMYQVRPLTLWKDLVEKPEMFEDWSEDLNDTTQISYSRKSDEETDTDASL